MNRRNLFTAILAAGIALALPAGAQSPSGYVELSPPQVTDSPDKIEVLEFFSYTCIHCSNVHPAAKQWAAKLPPDVVFKRIPVVFDPRQEPTARLFYALEATGDLARLDDAIFAALHVQKLHMMTDKAVLDWVAGQGVDMKKFEAAYRSFGVQSKVRRGVTLAQAYKVTSTPMFFVNGKFRVDTTEPSGYGRMFGLIDDLIGRQRPIKARGIRG
jgi:protein dithiol oxidoreductase (disulfide-forming)